jgi:hypothetical protein
MSTLAFGGMLQVGPARDRRSCGILGGHGSPKEPVDRARAMENANGAFTTARWTAQKAPPTTAHKALMGFTDEEQMRKMTRLAKGKLLTAVVASLR